MTSTLQMALLLFAVLVVVAIAARRLDIAPSILLVVAGVGLALIPLVAKVGTRAGTCAAGRFAAADLFGGRANELAGIPLQSQTDRLVCGWMRHLHRMRHRVRRALALGPAAGRRIRAGAQSLRRPMWSRLLQSRAALVFPGVLLSFSKAKALPMTPRP